MYSCPFLTVYYTCIITILGRGLSHFLGGKIIVKIVYLGSKKSGLFLHFWENCMILKKISIGNWSLLYKQKNH
jgi:hypothetical protein